MCVPVMEKSSKGKRLRDLSCNFKKGRFKLLTSAKGVRLKDKKVKEKGAYYYKIKAIHKDGRTISKGEFSKAVRVKVR